MEAQDIILLSKENRQYLSHHFLNVCCIIPLNNETDFKDIDFILEYLTGNIKNLQPDWEISNMIAFKAYIYSSVLPKSKYGTFEGKRNTSITILKKPLSRPLTEYCFTFVFNNKYELNMLTNTFSNSFYPNSTPLSSVANPTQFSNNFYQVPPQTATTTQSTNAFANFSQTPFKFSN